MNAVITVSGRIGHTCNSYSLLFGEWWNVTSFMNNESSLISWLESRFFWINKFLIFFLLWYFDCEQLNLKFYKSVSFFSVVIMNLHGICLINTSLSHSKKIAFQDAHRFLIVRCTLTCIIVFMMFYFKEELFTFEHCAIFMIIFWKINNLCWRIFHYYNFPQHIFQNK